MVASTSCADPKERLGKPVYLGELLETGRIRPLIDRRYPLSESAEAFEYLGEGHARGKVLI